MADADYAITANDFCIEDRSWQATAGSLMRLRRPIQRHRRPIAAQPTVTSQPAAEARTFVVETDSNVGWLPDAVHRVNYLLSMPPGWDSYGARPVDFESALRALRLVILAMSSGSEIRPQIAATPRGGIQIEWVGQRGDLEVAVEKDRINVLLDLVDNPAGSFEQTMQFSELAESLRGYIDRLA